MHACRAMISQEVIVWLVFLYCHISVLPAKAQNTPFLAGSRQTLNCSHSGNVNWTKNGIPLVTNDSRVTVNNTIQNISMLTFNPLRTSDGALYRCVQDGSAMELNVTIPNSVSIVNVFVNLSTTTNGTLYEATPVDIICTVTVNENVDTPFNVTIAWGFEQNHLISADDYSINGDTLRIKQLNRSRDNTREITCISSVIPSPAVSQFVQQNMYSSFKDKVLTVEAINSDLLVPTLIFTDSGLAGKDCFIVICFLEDGVIERLVGTTVTLALKHSRGEPSDTRQGRFGYGALFFDPLRTSVAGEYICNSTTITPVGQFSANATQRGISIVRILPPQVILTITPSSTPLYKGSSVNLTCTATLNTTVVDTAVTVSSVWTGPSGEQLTNASRVTIIDMFLSSPYQSVILFDPVNDQDSGQYHCNFTIEQASGTAQILPAISSANISLNISATPSLNVKISHSGHTHVGALFRLVCDVEVTEDSTLQPSIQWSRTAIASNSSNSCSNNTISVPAVRTNNTVTLTFDPLKSFDAGEYICTATVMLANNSTVSNSSTEVPVVDLQSIPRPVTPIVINVTRTSTNTAVIVFINIARQAYSRERYFITYRGVERDMQERQTTTIFGMSDIVINTTHSYNITGLKESTTYSYTVTAVNCIGNASTSDVMNFTTYLQGAVDCSSTTVLARQVTLEWSAPPSSENLKYILNCLIMNSNFSIVTLDTTVNITTGIVPFTNYTCNLTAKTTIDTSAPILCKFETAQDIPSDSPQDIQITSSMTSVILQWQPPAQPNGIITAYKIIAISTQQTVILNGSTTGFTFCGLQPGQQVNYTISASTVAGEGPTVNIAVTTAEKMFSGVDQLMKVGSGGNSLNISWSPPVTPHGFVITNYIVTVVNNETEVRSAHRSETMTTSSYSIIESNLIFGVPYYITVTPLDDCNTTGDPASIVAFSKQLSPTVAVMFTANRSDDGTVIIVSWQPVTLEQARGFFIYQVILTPVSNKRQSTLIRTVPRTETSITVSDLDSGIEYTVSVRAVNENNTELYGPTQPPLLVTIPSSMSSVPLVIGIVASCVVLGLLLIIIIVFVALAMIRSRSALNKNDPPTVINNSLLQHNPLNYSPPVYETVDETLAYSRGIPEQSLDNELEMSECAAYGVNHKDSHSAEIEIITTRTKLNEAEQSSMNLPPVYESLDVVSSKGTPETQFEKEIEMNECAENCTTPQPKLKADSSSRHLSLTGDSSNQTTSETQHRFQSIGSQPSYSYVSVTRNSLQPAQLTNNTPQTIDYDEAAYF